MPDKQKVTLYIPPGLHRQLKIRAAVDTDSMSAMVERALAFYLNHSEEVEEAEGSQGKTHQVHQCPECHSSLVMEEGQMVSLKDQPTVLAEEMPAENVRERDSQGEEELVPC
ncbi:MAG: hypothetical protein BRC47_14455 [Cyanobacteria bacterium QS_7_48_42]|nr:MAG: hypothetical protein BRC47_14455 [Cyanobacteria bacterium QS_7_48_42]